MLFISTVVFAQPLPQIFAFHINGIDTTAEEAQANLLKLEETNKIRYSNKLVVWDLIYNSTKSSKEWTITAYIQGVWDVLWQKWYETSTLQSLDDYTEFAMKKSGVSYAKGSIEYKTFQDSLIKDVQEQFIDYGGKNLPDIIDQFHRKIPFQFASFLKEINSNNASNYAENPNYVILLPHSQGNIYANELYNYLTQTENFNRKNIAIFGFATPAKEELGKNDIYSSNYVNSTNDGVINLLKFWLPSGETLRNNVDIPKHLSDLTGHSLNETYLNNETVVKNYNNYFYTIGHQYFEDIKLKYGKFEIWVTKNAMVMNGSEVLCKDGICANGQYFQSVDKSSGEKDTTTSFYNNVKPRDRQYYLYTDNENINELLLYSGVPDLNVPDVRYGWPDRCFAIEGNNNISYYGRPYSCNTSWSNEQIKCKEEDASKPLFVDASGSSVSLDTTTDYVNLINSYFPQYVKDKYLYTGKVEISAK